MTCQFYCVHNIEYICQCSVYHIDIEYMWGKRLNSINQCLDNTQTFTSSFWWQFLNTYSKFCRPLSECFKASQGINSLFLILKIFSFFRFLNSYLEECDQLAENQLNNTKLWDAKVIGNIKSLHCEKRELKALLKKVKNQLTLFFKIQSLSLSIFTFLCHVKGLVNIANMKGHCK